VPSALLTYPLILNNSPACQVGSAISILQMRKWWFREIKELAQGHRARK